MKLHGLSFIYRLSQVVIMNVHTADVDHTVSSGPPDAPLMPPVVVLTSECTS